MMKLKTKTGTIAEIGKIDKIDEKIIDKFKKIQVYNLLYYQKNPSMRIEIMISGLDTICQIDKIDKVEKK